jgi:hypothetical protein
MIWTTDERIFLRSLNTPEKIQNYLDSLIYNPQDASLSPRYVMLTQDGHCLEGALLAAAALEFHGQPPLVLDLQAEDFDDSHVIAVYKTKTGWGSLGKSNTTLLAGRSPIYRSIRELVMSYFDFYFDVNGRPSLRAYSNPINLNRYNHLNWRTSDEDLMDLGISFNDLAHYELVSPRELSKLPLASPRLRHACFLGADPDGLYKKD